jgi:hypothetical protein
VRRGCRALWGRGHRAVKPERWGGAGRRASWSLWGRLSHRFRGRAPPPHPPPWTVHPSGDRSLGVSLSIPLAVVGAGTATCPRCAWPAAPPPACILSAWALLLTCTRQGAAQGSRFQRPEQGRPGMRGGGQQGTECC